MKTKYEIVIDSIAYAMGDHSYNIVGILILMNKILFL